MSTISVSNIVTANGSETLTIATGNTFAGDIILPSTGGVIVGPNSTINSIIVSVGSTANMMVTNSTGIFALGNVNMDTGVLFVDGTNNRVGISNTTPDTQLTVTGSANVSGNVTILGSANIASNLNVTGSINVASNTFNLGTSTSAANGYMFLPNGLKMNWGMVAAANTAAGTRAVYTSAFTTATYMVQVSHQGNARTVAPLVVASNTTGANISSGIAATTGTNVYFLAIGL